MYTSRLVYLIVWMCHSIGQLAFPDFMPQEFRKEFFVRVRNGIQERNLYPVAFYRMPDIPHQGKNAEKAMTTGCLGGGICLADGQYKTDLLKAA